jgi:hypothetical protein
LTRSGQEKEKNEREEMSDDEVSKPPTSALPVEPMGEFSTVSQSDSPSALRASSTVCYSFSGYGVQPCLLNSPSLELDFWKWDDTGSWVDVLDGKESSIRRHVWSDMTA